MGEFMGNFAITTRALLVIISLAATAAWAQPVSLRPSLEEEVIDTKIGGTNVFSVGFYADSNVLLNRPFVMVDTPSKFSYQVPIGFGADFALGLSPRWEIGASIGYEKFEARELGLSDENYVTSGFASVPVRINLRRRWPELEVAPEIEVSLGASFQNTTIRSTLLGTKTFEETRITPYAHLGGGISYAWGIDLTIHFMAGYAAMMNGSKTYQDGAQFTVKTNNLVHGLFTKGMVRVQF
jgi:opacity protein-like surface antigen